ncbi:MAG: Uncharacterised protein [Rhodobiaceae bacterium UBA7378]|nr:MAG: Uncharacterised protein [Rhodobiaceae bacterium UBA7378]
MPPISINNAMRTVLQTAHPQEKAAGARRAWSDWRRGNLSCVFDQPHDWPDRPARPARPELLHPREMPARRLGSETGRAAQIHALAHIELNAIDLACDMAGRFTDHDLPKEFFSDWLSIAADEARHFMMLEKRLNDMGFAYGDFPAHDGLWEAAYDTRHDLVARLVVVPMVLEARGLDVTPGMIKRFDMTGDAATVQILEIIYEDEMSHVAAGVKWFNAQCAKESREPVACFHEKVDKYFKGRLKPPFNETARTAAGMPLAFYTKPAATQH